MDCALTYIPPYLSPSLLPFKAKCFFVTRPYPSLSRLAANTNNNANANPIPNRGSGNYSEDSLMILESLRRWSIPVAVGASVGSLIPHKLAIFAVSFSFLLPFVYLQVFSSLLSLSLSLLDTHTHVCVKMWIRYFLTVFS